MNSEPEQTSPSLRRARALLVAYAVLTLAIMVFIFWMSAQPGETSSSESDWIVFQIISIFFPAFDTWPPDVQEDFVEILTHIVRKMAHMIEYACLAASAALTLLQEQRVRELGKGECPEAARGGLTALPRSVFAGWVIASAYAATDEFHQLFVPERNGLVGDVAIDAIGAAIGVLIVLAVWHSGASGADRGPSTRTPAASRDVEV